MHFRYVVFHPFLDEILIGEIKSCSQDGVHGELQLGTLGTEELQSTWSCDDFRQRSALCRLDEDMSSLWCCSRRRVLGRLSLAASPAPDGSACSSPSLLSLVCVPKNRQAHLELDWIYFLASINNIFFKVVVSDRVGLKCLPYSSMKTDEYFLYLKTQQGNIFLRQMINCVLYEVLS